MKAGIGTRGKKRRKGGAGRTSISGRNPVAAGVTVTLVIVTLAPDALANPQNGQVVAGQATISSSGTRLEVRQSTEQAIVNWHSFSIGPGEHTHFQQPSAASTTLNRVTGPDPSSIAGRMSANGRVILVNPSGIAFSRGAQVDVNSLIATTADIANRDFMEGRLRFDRASTKPGAAVSNEGEITVQEAGLAALVAPSVANSGTINARLGKVVLGGAEAFVLDLHGDGLISFQIVEPASPDAGGAAGRRSASNSGTIRADGGLVEITAADARGVVDGVVNMTGVVSARTVHRTGGKVVIGGGRTGSVTVDGRVDVSGAAPGQTGGSVAVLGQDVRLGPAARIDASGQAGGGRVEVGGSLQGRGPQPNARRTRVDSGARITADATGSGNGGTAIVWADESTWFAGAISARGGTAGGNGGLVEVSGKQQLVFRGTVDTLAPAGRAGTTLLDPVDIVIASAAVSDDSLLAGDGVLHGDTISGGTATFTPTALAGLTGDVVLQAARDITVTDPVTFGAGATSASLQAGRTLSVNAAVQTTGGARLDLLAGRNFDPAYGGTAGALVTTAAVGGGGTGAISFAAGTGGITLGGNVTAAGSISFTQPVTLGGTVTIDTTNGGAAPAGGAVQFSGALDGNGAGLRIDAGNGGALSVAGAASNLAGLTLTGGGTANFQGSLSINAGGALDLSGKTGGSVTVHGALATPDLTTSGNGYSVALLGGGTVDNAVTFLNTGTVTLGNEATDTLRFTGGVTATAPSSKVLAGQVQTTNTAIDFGTSPTRLTADTVLSSGSGAVSLAAVTAETDGGAGLTVTGSGTTSFNGAVGGAAGGPNRLSALTSNGGGTTVLSGDSVHTTGNQLYDDAVRLGSDMTLSGVDVTFSSTVDSVSSTPPAPRALVVSGSGITSFNGAVGGTNPLSRLTLTGGGTANFQGSLSINAGGALDLSGKTGGSVTVHGALATPDLTTSGNGYSVALLGGGTVDNAVTFLNTGTVTLGNEATDTLRFTGGVTATAPSSKVLAGQVQTTNTAIDFGTSPTRLTADTVLSSGSGAVSLAAVTAETDGGAGLTVTGSGTTSFNGAVGGAAGGPNRLSALTSNGGGTTVLSGDSVHTTGNQLYDDAVRLGSDMTLSGVDVTFSSTVDSVSSTPPAPRALVVSGSGITSFNGAVGGTNPLSRLTLTGGGTANFQGSLSINAGGALDLSGKTGGSVTVHGALATPDLTTSGNGYSVALLGGGTVDNAVTFLNTGTVTLGNEATDTLRFTGGVTATAPSSKVLAGQVQTTNTAIDFGTSPTRLTADTVLSSGSGAVSLAAVTAETDGGAGLTVTGSGTTSFNGAVGGAAGGPNRLSALTSNGGGTTVLSGDSVHTTGNQLYDDAVRLGSDMTLSGVDVTFSSTVDSVDTTARALVASGSGTTSFKGAVGGADALSALTSDNGGTTVLSGVSVHTTGNQSYNDAVTLKTSSTLTSTANGRISFGGTVDPESDLAAGLALVTGGDVAFTGALGSAYRLGALSVTGAYNLSAGSSIRAASLSHSGGGGTSNFVGSLDTNASPGISIVNGGVSIGGPVRTGSNNLVIAASGTGPLVLGTSYDAGTATAQFVSGGLITQTGGTITAGTLTGSAGGSASLTRANSVTTLGGFTTGSGGFAFTNASSLAVSGPVTAGGDLSLVVSSADGTLTLGGGLSAAGHAIGLKAGGSISQATGSAAAALTAQTLLVRAGAGGSGSAELTNRSNAIASAIAGSAAGSFDLASRGTLTLGSLSAVGAVEGTAGLAATGSGGTVRLQSETGDVVQAGGAPITATTLLVHAGRSSGSGSVLLADTGNRVSGGVAGSAGQSGGGFTFTNVSGITVADDRTVTGAGTITAQAGIVAAGWDGAIRLRTLTGDITQQAQAPLRTTMADLRAGLSGAGSVALVRAANMVGELSGSATGSFALSTGSALRITGTGLAAGTTAHLQAQGGDLIQAAGANLTAPKLLAQASGGIALMNPGNAIGTVAGTAGTSIRLHAGGDLTVGSVASLTTTEEIKGLTAAGDLAEIRVGRQGAGSLTLDQPVLATDKTFLQARGAVTVSRPGRFTSKTVVIDTTDDASFGPGDFAAGDASPDFLKLAKRRPALNGNIALGETYAGNSEFRLFAGSGTITGTIHAKGLGVAGVGGSASLFGTVGGRPGTAAAQLVFKQLPRENAYKFNNCAIGGVTCVVLPPFEPVRPEPTLAGPLFHQVFPPADPIRDNLINTGNEDFIRRWTK
ncbi:filamentous hemagglutinin N-terminal domain-containing protein [Azospirillum thermophilum]|nr:filamentous hemagglutinin N-terminal domain-containing protein [Azospirillum thermophilum]